MLCAEWKSQALPHDGDAETVWAVRVLLAAALARALRAGLSREDIFELLRELEERGGTDA